jgi:ectoine hydroxylase-related dioxygenase (phytanoyl-CoA dioxygenase family)
MQGTINKASIKLSHLVSNEVVASFQQDGVVVLRDVFGPWIEGVRQAIEQNKENPSWRERTYEPQMGSGTEFFQDYCVWSHFSGYRALVVDSPMASIAAQLMGSKTARIFHDHVLVKEPGSTAVTPWHHDQPYYIVDGEQSVSFWVPLDKITRERSIEYVATSHKWGKSYAPKRFDGTDLYPNDKREKIPDIDAIRKGLDIRGWEMKPGDTVAFDFRTLHSAPGNTSTIRRRVTSIRWVGDDARFVKRPGKTSPYFPDLEYEDGDLFSGKEFPILHP